MKIKATLTALLCGTLLSSCVDSTVQLVEGGMSGTGITSGQITGFGSIYVNGIHYDVDQATFYRDGEIVSGQDAFKVGEFVTVTGNANDTTGVATQVSFSSLLRGEISSINQDDGSLVVMGQTIYTDDFTIVHGVNTISELQIGNVVEISGIQKSAGEVTATSVTLQQTTYVDDGSLLKLAGRISELSISQHSFRLGSLLIDFAPAQLEGLLSAEQFRNGMYVEVEALQSVQDNRLQAYKIRARLHQSAYAPDTRLAIEGVISQLNSSTQFVVDRQLVQSSEQTRFINTDSTQLRAQQIINVSGFVDAQGTLQADTISVRRHSIKQQGIRLTGGITAISQQLRQITVQGKTLTIDNRSMLLGERTTHGKHHSPIRFSQLNIGDYVEVDAVQLADQTFKVLRLDKGGRSRHTSSDFSSEQPDRGHDRD